MTQHSLKQIVKGTEAVLTHVCAGKVYYNIIVEGDEEDSLYQLEIDSNEEEWKTTFMYPTFKAITLMRWIKKGMKNETFIQLK